LVFWISELLGTPESELGIKGKSGIFKNMETRAAYLANPDHPVCFIYTPKHCSWLHQIEIWFSILSKKTFVQGAILSLYRTSKNKLNSLSSILTASWQNLSNGLTMGNHAPLDSWNINRMRY
jgi:hypothetical protein